MSKAREVAEKCRVALTESGVSGMVIFLDDDGQCIEFLAAKREQVLTLIGALSVKLQALSALVNEGARKL